MIGEWTLQAVATALQGELRGASVAFAQVTTDSRAANAGSVFVALRGERFDGHAFVAQAAAQGAVAAIVDDWCDVDIPQLRVRDTQVALGQLGGMNRDRFAGTVVALTGSAGKTTTKDMLATLLSVAGETLATRGNLNNEIGLPLTLLAIESHHRYAVLEMGAGKPGDIAYLCQFAKPDIGLVTSILPAHVEGMGSVEGIAETKGAMYAHVRQAAVINMALPWAAGWRNSTAARVITVHREGNADVWASEIAVTEDGVRFRLHIGNESLPATIGLLGLHNLDNALLAAAAAHAAGLSPVQIVEGFARVRAVPGRLTRMQGLCGTTLLDDTYNANPGAMQAAIDVLASQPAARRVLAMGDMLELGEKSAEFHADVGRYAAVRGIDLLLAVGEQSAHAAQAFGSGARHFDTQAALVSYAASVLGEGDVVLVKGSRGSRMDHVVAALAATAQQFSEEH